MQDRSCGYTHLEARPGSGWPRMPQLAGLVSFSSRRTRQAPVLAWDKTAAARPGLGSFTVSFHPIPLAKVSPWSQRAGRQTLSPDGRGTHTTRGERSQPFCKQPATPPLKAIHTVLTVFNINVLFSLRLKQEVSSIENSTP